MTPWRAVRTSRFTRSRDVAPPWRAVTTSRLTRSHVVLILNLHLALEWKNFLAADSARRLVNLVTLQDGGHGAANIAAAAL